MALADLVLEGLTLILVIALGAVLIGGLTYLSTTVASANGARLVGMGTYIYIPGAVYLNGTLYVPMYNIGHYTVIVRQVFIRVGNTLISQTLNTTLAPGQYYVYTTTLNQGPTAVTVVASPTVEPRLKLEFSANVTEPGQVALMPVGTNTGGNGLIEVVVNDPYGAGWVVAWSYAGQSYSMAQSTTYTWYLNPPYVPIQITFNAQVTQSPGPDYHCTVSPSQLSGVFGPGQVVIFNVTCTTVAYVTVYSPIMDGQWVIQTSAGSISGSRSMVSDPLPVPQSGGEVTAYTTNPLCTITPASAYASPGQSLTFNVTCTTEWLFNVQCPLVGSGFEAYWLCPTITINWQTAWGLGPAYSVSSSSTYFEPNSPGNYTYSVTLGEPNEEVLDWSVNLQSPGWYYGSVSWTASPSSGRDAPGGVIIYVLVSSSQSSSSSSGYLVYVTVTNDTLGAQWTVSSSVAHLTDSTDVSNAELEIGGPEDTLYASITINPSGYACNISPSTVSAENGSSYTFTVSCVESPQPPCTVEPPSVSTSPSGVAQVSSYASVSSISYGTSENVTFTYEAPATSGNYLFQYWVIGGKNYTGNTVSITETLTCNEPGKELTGPRGTAYYAYQRPGSISIDPDTINLTKGYENYTLAWTSTWNDTGTLTWVINGTVTIYYNETPSGTVSWWAEVTGAVNGKTVTFAQGSGDLAITTWPNPPSYNYYIVCTVSGSGSVPNVSASGGEATVEATITCTLRPRIG